MGELDDTLLQYRRTIDGLKLNQIMLLLRYKKICVKDPHRGVMQCILKYYRAGGSKGGGGRSFLVH